MDCIFCKIINNEIPTKKIYEDDNYLAFFDIEPQMETHLLIIPKNHIESFHKTLPDQKEIVKWTLDIARKLIEKYNLKWCRLIMNSWWDHGQFVFHIHLHLMSHTVINFEL